jgi:hypothetical protein
LHLHLIKSLLISAVSLTYAAPAVARTDIVCSFKKLCVSGERRCRSFKYEPRFIRHDDKDIYAIVADASVEAIGVHADIKGEQGTIVSRNASAISPYATIYVLSFTPQSAILTETSVDTGDEPYSATMTGTCQLEAN